MLISTLHDKQTVGQIQSKCILTGLPFRIITDVIANFDEATHKDPFHWSSHLASTVDNTTKQTSYYLNKCNRLPDFSFEIDTLPEALNGLGLHIPR
mmetsp:Transcript_38301/g.114695  ORF Transcript_38301/g.114695 Transcript_38301/m.114695 type:complete len:96 (-) Transcript_38301:397-684(-)